MTDATVSSAGHGADGRADAVPEQERVRRAKLSALRAQGLDPYATGFAPSENIGDIRSGFEDIEAGSRTGRMVSIGGRVMGNRVTGKLVFAEVRDWTGQIQIMLEAGTAGAGQIARWKDSVDRGDLVGVVGEVISSRRGELSVLVDSFDITSKCLVPLPDKYKGLTDAEARVRHRYVDMIMNAEARDLVALRAAMVRSIREGLWDRGFVEVETPMLQAVHGGANARPFETHINAYDMQLFLRIAPELYLKRLLVGGADKVFELNRNFRNEGADSTHNPEFTSLEMYAAYWDYERMRELTRELIIEAAIAVHGKPVVLRPHPAPTGGGSGSAPSGLVEVDISGEWPVVGVYQAVSEEVGLEITPATSLEELVSACDHLGITPPPGEPGILVLHLYEQLVEPKTTLPVFYKDFPVDASPLTRRKPSDPLVAERWDLVAWGSEIATAYTELTDPIDQRDRLVRQSMRAAHGDLEAMRVDEDFLRALEYGMPPAGGQGMGIDRLLMLLTGRNIRETILFPLVKPDE